MKRIIESRIFLVIITAIIVGSITGVVAFNYNAKDIGYTPSDTSWDVNNVSDALKDLKNNKGFNFNNDNILFGENYGTQVLSRNATINVEKGTYLVFAVFNFAAHAQAGNSITDELIGTVSCSSSNCEVEKLKSRYYTIKGNITTEWDSIGIFKVKIEENTDVLSYLVTLGNNDANNPEIVSLYAMKVN